MGYPTFDKLQDFIKYMIKLGYANQEISKGSLRIKLMKYMKVTTDAVIENYIQKLEEMGNIKKTKKNKYLFINEDIKRGVVDFE